MARLQIRCVAISRERRGDEPSAWHGPQQEIDSNHVTETYRKAACAHVLWTRLFCATASC